MSDPDFEAMARKIVDDLDHRGVTFFPAIKDGKCTLSWLTPGARNAQECRAVINNVLNGNEDFRDAFFDEVCARKIEKGGAK